VRETPIAAAGAFVDVGFWTAAVWALSSAAELLTRAGEVLLGSGQVWQFILAAAFVVAAITWAVDRRRP
jgi:hypothetical protein